MPEPQKIIKYRKTICKKNVHLDHPALLSAFSQLQMLPPATRESVNQKKQKGEASRFFQIPSASSTKENILFFFSQSELWLYIPEAKLIILFLQIYLVPRKFSNGFCEKLKGILLSSSVLFQLRQVLTTHRLHIQLIPSWVSSSALLKLLICKVTPLFCLEGSFWVSFFYFTMRLTRQVCLRVHYWLHN